MSALLIALALMVLAFWLAIALGTGLVLYRISRADYLVVQFEEDLEEDDDCTDPACSVCQLHRQHGR